MGDWDDEQYEWMLDDEYASDNFASTKTYQKQIKKCNKCGKTPLWWEIWEGRWRLFGYQNHRYVLHECELPPIRKASGMFQKKQSQCLTCGREDCSGYC